MLHPREQEDSMMRSSPMTWTVVQIGLAGAATVLLCSTDLLNSAAVFFH
jgi:hypothetical protein